MYKTKEILAKYSIEKDELDKFSDSEIPMVGEDGIRGQYFQSVLDFIENKDNQIQNKVTVVADFENMGHRVSIYPMQYRF